MPNLRKTLAFELAAMLERSLRLLEPEEVANVARLTARRLGHDERRPLAGFAQHLWDEVSNVPNEPELDGEFWLLERLGPAGFETIFDVGANIGGWAAAALKWNPNATVHCFEIVEATFAMLSAKLASFGGRVVLNQIGLLDSGGSVPVHVSSSHYISSIYRVQLPSEDTVRVEESAVATGDSYVRDRGIERIDLLKIDVEGAELKVLGGFRETLAAGRVAMLQFEYNRGAVYGGFMLKHVYELLQPMGFVLGKLTPRGVLFREFAVEHENFSGPNYVAVQRGREDLIGLLSAAA